jgi:hypothetical protein
MSITAFAVAAGQNTGDKNDATGAFLPGAQQFAKAYGCAWRQFDNSGEDHAQVRKRFYDTIETNCPGGTNLFAYFGHGIAAGLPSPNVYGGDLDDLLKVLGPKISRPFVAVLYACSAGSAGGFTGKLREKLGDSAWVYGHTTAGHSFLNPDVSEEAACNSPTFRALYPSGAELRGPWAEALKYTDLWLRFPLLEDAAIAAEVNARRLLGEWEVTVSGAPRRCAFDQPYEAWTLTSGRDIDKAPSGTVKVANPKKTSSALEEGTWEITSQLTVTWNSGATEVWQLPLRLAGQQGTAGGSQLTARRLGHSLGHGKIQG